MSTPRTPPPTRGRGPGGGPPKAAPFRRLLPLFLLTVLPACAEDPAPPPITPEPETPAPRSPAEPTTEEIADAARADLRAAGFAPTVPLGFASDEDDAAVYDRLATLLLAIPRVTRVRVGVHSDPRGSAEWNRRLTLERARAAAAALVARGVPCERLEPTGYGEDHPVEGAAPDAQRRVELTLLRVDDVDLVPDDVEGPDACADVSGGSGGA